MLAMKFTSNMISEVIGELWHFGIDAYRVNHRPPEARRQNREIYWKNQWHLTKQQQIDVNSRFSGSSSVCECSSYSISPFVIFCSFLNVDDEGRRKNESIRAKESFSFYVCCQKRFMINLSKTVEVSTRNSLSDARAFGSYLQNQREKMFAAAERKVRAGEATSRIYQQKRFWHLMRNGSCTHAMATNFRIINSFV